jgi:hypothetical protein
VVKEEATLVPVGCGRVVFGVWIESREGKLFFKVIASAKNGDRLLWVVWVESDGEMIFLCDGKAVTHGVDSGEKLIEFK